MPFRAWLAGATCAMLATVASAATITDVPDAADTFIVNDQEVFDPFDIYVGSSFEFGWHFGRLTREPINGPGIVIDGCDATDFTGCRPVREHAWSRTYQMMNIEAEIGIFHDWALTVDLPITFADEWGFDYADGVSADNSTLDPGNGTPLIPAGSRYKRSGVGALELGMKVAPLSDERDDSKPMWVIYFKWGVPFTANVWDPETTVATADAPAPMGDGAHRLTFGTSLSRRIGTFGLIGIDASENRRGYTDPYIDISYSVPLPTASHSPEPLVYNAQLNPFGESPSHVGRLRAGFEVIPFERIAEGHKVAIDVAFNGQFNSEGRNYSIISAPLQELTYTEQFFEMGGLIGLNVDIASYIRFQVGFGVGYISEYFMTYENVGEDVDGSGNVEESTPQNPSSDRLNPYYCGWGQETRGAPDTCERLNIQSQSYDQNGFRIKSEEQVVLRLTTGLLVTF